jgi:nucleoside-diphosphate-sugar epimerase
MSDKPIVVVTGASGFLATHVIKKLIERGYPTRGTVRNLSDKDKVGALKELFPTLELFEAELTKEGSFDDVMKDATYVVHVASPFPRGAVADPLKDLVEPAVQGTKSVLASATKAGTVKRIVITSSLAAITGKRPPGHVYTEEDWNLDTTATVETYRYSKRMAEETAWNYVKEHQGFDLVSMNPSFIIGPPLSKREDATTIIKVKELFEGKSDASCTGCVSVHDVAEAHVRALEIREAKGRYILACEESIPNIELSKKLVASGQFSQYPLPTKNDFPPPTILKFSHRKAEKELGLTFTPIADTLVEMGHALIQFGIIAKK